MSVLEWSPLTDADLPGLTRLAEDCLRTDGGLPQLASEEMLRTFFLADRGIGGRDETGDLVAAGGLFVDGALQRTVTGLVHPQLRGQGIGDELVRWSRAEAPGPLVVRIENVSVDTDSLLADAGMVKVFEETVMRHSLRRIPVVPRPEGLTAEPFRDDTAPAFHLAYRRSFADRPGFPDTALDEWVATLSGDSHFLPDESRVVLDPDGEPVGFVTVSTDWVDQVGVAPQWRGLGVGAHLVVRSLTALQRAGSTRVWLCVNVDNPARALYERLGFRARGRRARYEDRP